jgi:hypothetical protein
MTAVDQVAEAEQEILDLFAPLKARDAELAREIAELEEQIHRLRSVRTRVRAVIRTSEPDYGKKNGRPTTGRGIADDRLERFAAWLVENAAELNAMHEGLGFYASGLEREWQDRLPADIKRQTDISKAVKVLHERGVIRLASVGNQGRRNFKVVT